MSGAGVAREGSPVTVEVRWARVGALDADVRARLLATLSGDERERYARFRAGPGRDGFLAAHAVLRAELSRRASVAPQGLRLEARADGKPELVEPRLTPRLDFNLTHAHGVVALAMARDADVGIDVEDVARRVGIEPLEARVLSESERRALAGLDAVARRRRFFECWTLREAYAKATGIGMAQTLGVVEFAITSSGIDLRLTAASDAPARARQAPHTGADAPGAWSFHLCDIAPRFVLAVAARAPAIQVALSETKLSDVLPA